MHIGPGEWPMESRKNAKLTIRLEYESVLCGWTADAAGSQGETCPRVPMKI
jgi:hypothetical protein